MTDDYVTVSRQLLREAHRLIYRLVDKIPSKKITADESLEMAAVLMGLQLAMTKRAAE
jgi:hypothetical protein